MDFKIYQIFASFVMLFFTIGIVSLKIWGGVKTLPPKWRRRTR